MSKKTLSILTLFFSMVCYGQHTDEKIELEKFKLIEGKLCKIITNSIKHEKKCDYYSNDLIFTISANQIESGISLLIETIEDKNIALGLKPTGYFKKDKHLFLVDGNGWSQFFISSNQKKEFEYVKYDPTFQDPNNKKIVVHYFTDDSFSQWQYIYEKGEFKLKNTSTFCK